MKRKLISNRKRTSDNISLAEMKKLRAELEETQQGKIHRRYSEKEYERAIKVCGGYRTQVAKLLGVSPGAVTQRIKKSERLQTIMDEILQECLDTTELKLMQARDEGQPYAIQFILRSKGRVRGWGERVDIDATVRPAGGVLVVPAQVSSSEEFEKIAIKTQRELEYKIEHGFHNNHGEDKVDEEKNQTEEEKFIQSSYNFEE